jgi:hypothetical protein
LQASPALALVGSNMRTNSTRRKTARDNRIAPASYSARPAAKLRSLLIDAANGSTNTNGSV